jgi:hypothetical protein
VHLRVQLKFTSGGKGNRRGDDCYRCGGRGHHAVECPTRVQRSALYCGDDTVDEDSKQETSVGAEDEEGETLEFSNLPVCVIRRILTGERKEDEDGDAWLRTNIFHTRVAHGDKSLNVIIDNRSGMNVVSLDAVQKLQLTLEKHPQPYKVSWVDNTTIPMKQRCLVHFSLGKAYRDAVWCDVIPMRACHVFLGRPWLFDRRVQYDGYRNSYAFLYEGRKLILKPMKVHEFTPPEEIISFPRLKSSHYSSSPKLARSVVFLLPWFPVSKLFNRIKVLWPLIFN